jgi:hypothetical protein
MKYQGWMKQKIELAIIIIAAFLLSFEAYAIAIVHLEGKTKLPENFGNFEHIRNALGGHELKDGFLFAVVGDPISSGTFERLCGKLRGEPLSFMVILGDFVQACTKNEHNYFVTECANKYRLPFPVFLVVGNRDVAYDEMNYDISEVSLADFEKMYGPLNFAFEYNRCLFIRLCILPTPFSTRESIEFLNSTLAKHREKNRKVFVFTYMHPVMSAESATDNFENAQALIDVIDRYKVDYVISAHYHGYTEMKRGDTIYLVIGCGTLLNDTKTSGGLPQAVILIVNPESVLEQTVSVRRVAEISGILKHFAMVDVHPFLIRHPALTIVENFLVLSLFCVLLRNFIMSGKTVR